MTHEPIQTINLKGVVDIADLVSEFKEKYMTKMFLAKEAMWNKRNGLFKDDLEAEAYNDLCERCEFLEGLLNSLVQMTGYVATVTANLEGFNEGVKEMKLLDSEGNFRTKLMSPQIEFLTKYVKRFEGIIETHIEYDKQSTNID